MKRDLLETIGSPIVRVDAPPGVAIGAKLESFNPGHSAKDRPARAMIAAAEAAGDLQPGGHIVEPTSGNTGIGLAIVAAVRGYRLTIVMPRSKSIERRRLLRAYGAEIELVEGDISAARERASELSEELGAIQLDQFENPANVDAHYATTGQEIIESVGDRTVDAFVATIGTGGTITGAGRRLREEYPDVTIVGVEPEGNAPLATGTGGTDDFQGMGPGFVSDILDTTLIDRVETVDLAAAEAACRRLAREEGILVGQSSGAAVIAARRIAGELADPATEVQDRPTDGALPPREWPLVITIFPDSGERYLSTGTFDEPENQSTEEY